MPKSVDRRQQFMPIAYLSLPTEEQEEIVSNYNKGQHLYFILAQEHNMVKIGVARDPFVRLRTLQSGSPASLEIVHVIPFGGYLLESRLHKQFQEFNRRGEWFDYTEPIQQFIQEAKKISQEVGLVWNAKTHKVQHDTES